MLTSKCGESRSPRENTDGVTPSPSKWLQPTLSTQRGSRKDTTCRDTTSITQLALNVDILKDLAWVWNTPKGHRAANKNAGTSRLKLFCSERSQLSIILLRLAMISDTNLDTTEACKVTQNPLYACVLPCKCAPLPTALLIGIV